VDEKSDSRGIQKARGTNSQSDGGKDLFLSTLWEIIDKEINFIKTQMPRFHKYWNQYFIAIEPNPHIIQLFEANKDEFFDNDKYKVEILKKLEQSLMEGYYAVKTVVITLFHKYFQNSELFCNTFIEEDRHAVIFMAAEKLIGSLLQFLSTEKDIVPLKCLITAKNRSMLKLKGLNDERILENLRGSGFEVSIENLHNVMEELISEGYVSKRGLTDAEKEGKDPTCLYFYKWIKDYKLTPAGDTAYRRNILGIIEWAVELWRTMFNFRELDVVIPEDYKWKSFLDKTVSKAATQGFMNAYWIVKNITKYYEMIIQDREKNKEV
jgi:hypothetical protein